MQNNLCTLYAEYYPLDDVLAKAVDNSGIMPSDLGPLNEFFQAAADHPLVPSGAALFTTAVLMLLDFSRPRWQPVTLAARDWVVRCLKWCASRSCACLHRWQVLLGFDLHACTQQHTGWLTTRFDGLYMYSRFPCSVTQKGLFIALGLMVVHISFWHLSIRRAR